MNGFEFLTAALLVHLSTGDIIEYIEHYIFKHNIFDLAAADRMCQHICNKLT